LLYSSWAECETKIGANHTNIEASNQGSTIQYNHSTKRLAEQLAKNIKASEEDGTKIETIRLLISLSENQNRDSTTNFDQATQLTEALALLKSLNITTIIALDWWISSKGYQKFLLEASQQEKNLGANAALAGEKYNEIRTLETISLLEEIQKHLGANLDEYLWGIDLRNESALIDTTQNEAENIKNLSALQILSSKIIALQSEAIKNRFGKLKTIASIYCPMTVGRISHGASSKSKSNLNPISYSSINNKSIDIIDIHLYPGGWAGKSVSEHILGCEIKKREGEQQWMIGEFGLPKKYWPNQIAAVADNEAGLSDLVNSAGCPTHILTWTIGNFSQWNQSNHDNEFTKIVATKLVHSSRCREQK
jgi:hypothetical protein